MSTKILQKLAFFPSLEYKLHADKYNGQQLMWSTGLEGSVGCNAERRRLQQPRSAASVQSRGQFRAERRSCTRPNCAYTGREVGVRSLGRDEGE